MEAARSKLSLANEGSRSEDRTAAQALASQAEQSYQEALAWRDERVLTSPVDGEIFQRIANCGEVVNAGAPVVTVINTANVWVVLNVKETLLNKFRQKALFTGTVPALGDTALCFSVTRIAPMGEFQRGARQARKEVLISKPSKCVCGRFRRLKTCGPGCR